VDNKPVNGTAHYRIKQINELGNLVAQAESKSITSPDANPIFMNNSNRMVQVK
jgi:hypothetical protein